MSQKRMEMKMENEERTAMIIHAVDPDFRDSVPDVGYYRLVAEVETDDVDEAFHLTNSYDNVWWTNEKVQAHVVPCRSTSVGDVIILPSNEAFLITRTGFRSVGLTWLRSAAA